MPSVISRKALIDLSGFRFINVTQIPILKTLKTFLIKFLSRLVDIKNKIII